MQPRPSPEQVSWSPIINVGFLTVPLCAGLLGGWFQMPLLATAICLPQAGWIAWFYRRTGAVVIGALATAGWITPWLLRGTATGSFDSASALIGPLMIFLFAWVNTQSRTNIDSANYHAETDGMTGLLNRRGFEARLAAEANRGTRTNSPITVVFMDCDNFKRLNDTKGHLVGDKLIRGTADVLLANVRNYDSVARLGGDEFTL
ncbi:MAG: GGDEF domain-containing protein, partial [Planctomycetaceae bacterium]|nr:GGDEF domain-containing protein [Planctomycetaceae bacterium]